MIYFLLFFGFFSVGFFCYGGPEAVLSMAEYIAVEQNGWLTHEQFADLIIVSRFVPGEAVVNSATLSGYIATYQAWGWFAALGAAFIAVLGLATPSFVWAELVYRLRIPEDYHQGVRCALNLLTVTVPGFILGIAFSLCTPQNVGSTESAWQLGISLFLGLATCIGYLKFRINPSILLLLCGLAGIILL